MPTQIVFVTIMMIGIMITISSSSWFSMWMGLEINMLSFIPIANSPILPMILIMTSLITLFFYMRITYAAFLLSSPHKIKTQKMTNSMLILSTSSLWTLPLIILLA